MGEGRFEATPIAATATLSSKFQISIPKSVREQQRWQGLRKDGYRDREDRY